MLHTRSSVPASWESWLLTSPLPISCTSNQACMSKPFSSCFVDITFNVCYILLPACNLIYSDHHLHYLLGAVLNYTYTNSFAPCNHPMRGTIINNLKMKLRHREVEKPARGHTAQRRFEPRPCGSRAQATNLRLPGSCLMVRPDSVLVLTIITSPHDPLGSPVL